MEESAPRIGLPLLTHGPSIGLSTCRLELE
jgi:hypothetical protein